MGLDYVTSRRTGRRIGGRWVATAHSAAGGVGRATGATRRGAERRALRAARVTIDPRRVVFKLSTEVE